MGALRFKPGVELDRLELGGAAIIGALCRTALHLDVDLTVTSGSDGEHSGPTDPHKLGRAVDVRSQDLSTAVKHSVLSLVMSYLAELDASIAGATPIEETSGGLACNHFFAFLENMGSADEHFHVQVRRGRTFPPAAVLPLRA